MAAHVCCLQPSPSIPWPVLVPVKRMLSNRQSNLDCSNSQREPGLGFPMSYSFFCDLFVLQTCGLTLESSAQTLDGFWLLDQALLRYYLFSTTGKLEGSILSGCGNCMFQLSLWLSLSSSFRFRLDHAFLNPVQNTTNPQARIFYRVLLFVDAHLPSLRLQLYFGRGEPTA